MYAIKLTTATTVALLFGTLPVLTGLFAFALGIERLSSRFWLAAVLAFGGAALVALGGGGGVSTQLWGDLLGARGRRHVGLVHGHGRAAPGAATRPCV